MKKGKFNMKLYNISGVIENNEFVYKINSSWKPI